MRYCILFCLLASNAFGQSIVVSGGNDRSIIVSSTKADSPAETQTPAASAARATTPDPATPAARRTYLAMFTAFYCGPCQIDKQTVIPQIERSGFLVKQIEMTNGYNSNRYRRIRSFPSYVAIDYETGEWLSDVHVGQIDLATAKRMLEVQKHQHVSEVGTSIPQVEMPARYIQWPGWGQIDLETYNRNCNCSMCVSIRSLQQEYRRMKEALDALHTINVTPDQEGCPHDVVTHLLDSMQLRSDDILGELGCGDGRILIAAAKRGIRGIGVEIDPERADVARRNVRNAGVDHLVTIETGDVLDFDAGRITVATTFLYPPLLAKLAPKLKGLRVVGSPYHEIPGLPMVRAGDVWIYRGDSDADETVMANDVVWSFTSNNHPVEPVGVGFGR